MDYFLGVMIIVFVWALTVVGNEPHKKHIIIYERVDIEKFNHLCSLTIVKHGKNDRRGDYGP